MIKKGVMALAGAASLLFGSTVAVAQSSAASLSVADAARAGAPMADASAQGDDGLSQSVLIGIGIFVLIVAGFYFLAESDDPPISA